MTPPALAATVTGLVLLLNVTPGWGQPACASPAFNTTVSDVLRNTAGAAARSPLRPTVPCFQAPTMIDSDYHNGVLDTD
jgi:hypothetical protein